MEVRLTTDAGAAVLAGMEPYLVRIINQARKAGRTETREAYAADALVAMAKDRAGPRVDRSPWSTSWPTTPPSSGAMSSPGSDARFPAWGPSPVATARVLASDCFLKVLLTDGIDVTAVAHAGRTISAPLRTALDARDPTCVVKGCDVREGLEYDHVVPFAEGGPTSKENLVRQCEWHHYLKTHCGYRLVSGHGNWTLVGPDPPT
jgi:hypothetical protein